MYIFEKIKHFNIKYYNAVQFDNCYFLKRTCLNSSALFETNPFKNTVQYNSQSL